MNAERSNAAVVERTILGGCLLENEADTELVLSLLQDHHFHLDSHRRIFAQIRTLHMAQHPVNVLTVSEELSKSKQIEVVGGRAYVFSLTEGLPRRMGESLRNYAERAKESWRLRELQRTGALMQAEAEDGSLAAASVLQAATERMEAIVDDADEEDARMSAHIVGFMDRMNERRSLTQSPGMSYGLAELDRHTDGMMGGEQTAVGAVSGVGKTAFMVQAILGTLASGHAVDAFLLEPTKDQVTARLISLLTGIRYEALIKPWKMRREEHEKSMIGASQLANMPLRMFARSTMTLDEVLGHARLGMRKHGTRLICLDYIQRLKIRQTEKDEQVRLRVGRASTALADLVKGTQTHSLMLSQITTGRKSGAQSLPTMFDFRESSQIENDAHTIILLHREYDEAQGHYTNKGAIFVPKQRNGTPCNLQVSFDPITASWADNASQTLPAEYADRRHWND
jgi:replicative DNA helicase